MRDTLDIPQSVLDVTVPPVAVSGTRVTWHFTNGEQLTLSIPDGVPLDYGAGMWEITLDGKDYQILREHVLYTDSRVYQTSHKVARNGGRNEQK